MAAIAWAFVVAVAVGAEVATAGTFIALPFAVGAAAAAVAALAGAGVALQVATFLIASAASLALLRPVARRLDRGTPRLEVGAGRWTGRQAVVVEAIPEGHGGTGQVRLDREVWRAESALGVPIAVGATVLVTRVDGVRLVVLPVHEPHTTPLEGT